MRKTVFIGLFILLIFAITGLIFLKLYFTQERIKVLLLPALEKRLKGTIAIEELDFSLIRGVELRGIKLQVDRKEGESSFQCEQAFLQPRFLPLILGQLVVREIRLIRPQFFILGKVEGMVAFPPLFLKREIGEGKEEKSQREEMKGLSLMVEELKVEKGDLVLLNPGGYSRIPPVIQLEGIDFSASHLSLFSSIPFSFSGRLRGIESEPLRIKGVVNPGKNEGDLNILWEKLQVKSFNKSFHITHPFLSQGEIDLDFHLDISNASPVNSEGRIKITSGRFYQKESSEKKENGLKEDFDAEFRYQLTWDQGKALRGEIEKGRFVYRGLDLNEIQGSFAWEGKNLHLTEAKGKIGKGIIEGKGEIELEKEEPRFSINLEGEHLPLNELLFLSSLDLKKNISGIFSGEAELKGIWEKEGLSKEELRGKGEIHLQQGKITDVKPLGQLSVLLGYKGLSHLAVTEGRIDFQVEDGKVKTEGWLKAPDLEVSYRGYVKLDSQLKIILELKCSPNIFSNFSGVRITDLLKDEKGWITIPLKLKGTWDNPSLHFHSSEFKKRMKDRFNQLYKGL